MDRIKNDDVVKHDDVVKNDDAVINIDLMFAIILLLSVITAAIMTMPTLSLEDRSWRIEQYTVATRATDNLVQDTGEPGWKANWSSGNYSSVTKIGLLYVYTNGESKNNVLDLAKVKALMGGGYIDNLTGTMWWDFPNYSKSPEERDAELDNATRALGLTGYNLYMQLHPVGLDLFNSTPLKANLSNVKGINYDTASVIDRYVYIIDPNSSDAIKYLKYDNEAIHYRLNLWVW